MRKVFGFILLVLGGFLVGAAIVALVWAPGVIKKTPLDVDSKTDLSGTAQKLDTATGELVSSEIKITSFTKSDTDASTDDVIVFTNSQCVVINDDGDTPDCVDGEDDRLISASQDAWAADRETALAVSDFEGLPDDVVPHEGLTNKWPFDAEQKTYPYWDGTSGQAVDAVFEDEEEVDGMDAYRYKVEISDAPIEIAEGVPGTYDNVATLWIDPVTGAILNQTQDQQRYLENGDLVLDLKAGYTDEEISDTVSDTQDSQDSLNLILKTVPLVGFIGGALCLVGGLLLLLLGRGSSTKGKREATTEAPAESTTEA